MNKYTTEYAAEQLIWAIVDWEIIVNRHDGHRCWTEVEDESTMGKHARLIQHLMQGFRIDVGRKNFWHPYPESSWLTQGMESAQIAYGYKMVEGLSTNMRSIRLNTPVKISDHEINMYDVFKASCNESLVQHFIIDSLKFAIKMLAPLTPIGANPESTKTSVANAIDNDRKGLEQQIRTYLLKELQPLITILCAQAEPWVCNAFDKYPSAEEIREKYINEAADDWC